VFVARLATPAVAVVIAAGLCACDGSAPAATPSPSLPAISAANAFGGTDRAWIEINIAMNQELVPLLDLAPAHSHDVAVRALAAQLKGLHAKEMVTLRELHDEAGLPAENPHAGMPMPGMVTPGLVEQAAATDGPAFDSLFRQRLREHLEQGVHLAESESRSGVEPRSKRLAGDMIARRAAFLTKLGKAPE
jgi:uncharacterized protein (DUF305 family)